jgi:hypothetical protein
MFTIVGTPESTERALMLLYSQLESEKERRESTFHLTGLAYADSPGVNQGADAPESA